MSTAIATPAPSGNHHAHQSIEVASPAFRRLLVALTCAGIATFSQLYAPQAVIPRVAEDLRVSPASGALIVSASTIGLAVAVVPWSWVAVRIGLVRAMSLSLLSAAAIGVAVVFAPTYPALLGLRALEGLAIAGLPAVAIAYVQAAVHPRHTASVAAAFVASTAIGGLVGRVIATPVAADHGWRPAIAAINVSALLLSVAFVALLPRVERRARPDDLGTVLAGLRANLRSPSMLVLFAQGFLLMGAYVAVYNLLAFRLEAAPFSMRPATTTPILLVLLVGTAVAVVAGRWATRLGRLPVLVGATAAMGVGVLLLLTPSLALTVLGVALFTGGFFGAHAIASGWVAHRARSATAQATALYTLFYYVGSTTIGWAAGIVFTGFGWTVTMIGLLLLTVLATGLVIAHARRPGADR